MKIINVIISTVLVVYILYGITNPELLKEYPWYFPTGVFMTWVYSIYSLRNIVNKQL